MTDFRLSSIQMTALILKHANKNGIRAMEWGPDDFDVLDEDRRCIAKCGDCGTRRKSIRMGNVGRSLSDQAQKLDRSLFMPRDSMVAIWDLDPRFNTTSGQRPTCSQRALPLKSRETDHEIWSLPV